MDSRLLQIMVWVSNKTSDTIDVRVTNETGGSSNFSAVANDGVETASQNNWPRTGAEKATVKFRNAKKLFTVDVEANDKLEVYNDSVLVISNAKEIDI